MPFVSTEKILNGDQYFNYNYGSPIYNDNVFEGDNLSINVSGDIDGHIDINSQSDVYINISPTNNYIFPNLDNIPSPPPGLDTTTYTDGGTSVTINNPPTVPQDEQEDETSTAKPYPSIAVPAPDFDPIVTDSCNDAARCAPPEFVTDNRYFWDVVGDALADVFPFDVVGTIPAGTFDDCPVVSAYGREIELCQVKTIAGFLKYPVWVQTMFRLVLEA